MNEGGEDDGAKRSAVAHRDARQMMRPSGGFTEAVAAQEGPCDRERTLDRKTVTRGNERRAASAPRPKFPTDLFASIDQLGRRALFDARLRMLPDQTRFGPSDRGAVIEDSEVAGQTEPPRVGQPLTIAEDEIKVRTQAPEERDQGGNLSK